MTEIDSIKFDVPKTVKYECDYCGGFEIENTHNYIFGTNYTFFLDDKLLGIGISICIKCIKKVFDTILGGVK